MNIIIIFPKMEQARSVRSILVKSGYTVDAVCTSGAQALRAANDLDSGIIICPCRLPDMVYRELYEYLTPRYDLLVIGSGAQVEECAETDITALRTPLKVHELLQAVAGMASRYAAKKKQRRQKPKSRSAEENRVIAQAKLLLMEQEHMEEAQAHRYLQKRSMENGTGLGETARMILSLLQKDSGQQRTDVSERNCP